MFAPRTAADVLLLRILLYVIEESGKFSAPPVQDGLEYFDLDQETDDGIISGLQRAIEEGL